MEATTLVFPVIGEPIEKILLGKKKKGFGQGKWNGFGGKIREGETLPECAIRELWEESGLKANVEDLLWIGKINFVFQDQSHLDHPVDIFLLRNWQVNPSECEEMKPQWFSVGKIPFSEMWADDVYWFPKLISECQFEANCIYCPDGESVHTFFTKKDAFSSKE